MREYLHSPYEEVRGWSAWALGEIEDWDAIFPMESLLKKEKSSWVREKMEEAIKKIERGKEKKGYFGSK